MQQSTLKKTSDFNGIQQDTTTGPNISIEKPVKRGAEFAICTHRRNNKHQAYVCIVCDVCECIIGTEALHILAKNKYWKISIGSG